MDHFGATEFALPIGNYNALRHGGEAWFHGIAIAGLPHDDRRMTMARSCQTGRSGLLGRASNEDNRYWLRYWDDPEASRDLVRNGWIVTGDLARRDDDGYFWFEGRAGDMIKSAGYRIGPFEVESALLRHPAVAEAAVVGKPDACAGRS